MDKISKFLKVNTTSLSLLVQCISSFVVGFIILLDSELFIARITQIVLAYFFLIFLSNILEIIFSLSKGLYVLASSVLKAVISTLILTFLANNISKIWVFLPLILACWSLLVAFSNSISFLQYRNETSSKLARFLVSALLNLFFGGYFIFNTIEKLPASVTVVGVYLVACGFSLMFDTMSSIFTDSYKHTLKKRIRVTPPTFLTALIPISVLNSINKFFQSGETDVSLEYSKDGITPNVEVFVHVSKSLFGSAGHVDIAIQEKVVSFGGYDMESMKLGGGIGVGVLFEHYKKYEYIEFCQKQSNKTIFGFGLYLQPEELDNIINKLEEIKRNSFEWKCNAQQGNENATDYASMLYNTTQTKFYKFSEGSFKYYWMLGTNCVKLADTLLSASGLTTVLNGIITPGTYYSFLNTEFKRNGSRVVKRTVYHPINF